MNHPRLARLCKRATQIARPFLGSPLTPPLPLAPKARHSLLAWGHRPRIHTARKRQRRRRDSLKSRFQRFPARVIRIPWGVAQA